MSMIFMVDAVNLALDLDEIGRKPEKSQKYVGPRHPKNHRLADTKENHIKLKRVK
jgi:hypothetical protein